MEKYILSKGIFQSFDVTDNSCNTDATVIVASAGEETEQQRR